VFNEITSPSDSEIKANRTGSFDWAGDRNARSKIEKIQKSLIMQLHGN
jgi:hypothetical protein